MVLHHRKDTHLYLVCVCGNKKLRSVKTDANKQLLFDTLLGDDRNKAIRPEHM